MSNDTVVSLGAPARVSAPSRSSCGRARRLIEAAVTADLEEYVSGFAEKKLPDGRRRVVRNAHLPESKIHIEASLNGNVGLGSCGGRIPTWDLQAAALNCRTNSRQSASESPSAGGR